ncbi:MAG: cytochrome c family [Geobacteraceae bacterium]|nr:MAG: cytochrome c family [Geobacteraceae bacterium]
MGAIMAKNNSRRGSEGKNRLALFMTVLFVFTVSGSLLPGLTHALVTPLMHDSNNLGTRYGTWGTTQDCTWCHSPNTSNVKQVAATINTPTGSRPVIFTRMTASSNATSGIFGNDERTYALNASTNVCEVCHHKTTYHQYSSGKIADKAHTGHNSNRKDCIQCHLHGAGFKAGCNNCHGYPPTSNAAYGGPDGLATPATLALGGTTTTPPANVGAHAVHVTTKGMLCASCHNNNTASGHPGSVIDMGFVANATNWPGFAGTAAYGSYTGNNSAGAKSAASSHAGTIVRNIASTRNSCNVYCHGNWTGANRSLNPSWIGGATQDACGACHGTTAAQGPQTGSHAKHVASSGYSLACSFCHRAYTDNAHVDGNVAWKLNRGDVKVGTNATYKNLSSGKTGAIALGAAFGDCANVYCHSNGLATPTYVTNLTWGAASEGACGTCHGVLDATPPASAAHTKHVGTVAGYIYSCIKCHPNVSSTVNSTTTATITNTATHVNKTNDVTFDAFNPGAGSTCSATYCHSEGTGATGQSGDARLQDPPATAPTWTSTASCSMCHTGGTTTGPTYTSGKANSHALHTAAGIAYTCDVCHYATTTNGTTIDKPKRHVNKFYNISANTAKTGAFAYTYVSTGGTCASTRCHGARTVTWGANTTNAQCTKCHGKTIAQANYSTATNKQSAPGYGVTGVDTANQSGTVSGNVSNDAQVGAHDVHLRVLNKYANPTACSSCHTVPATVTAAGHMNGTPAAIAWSSFVTEGGTLTPSYTAGTCTNTYCHGGSMTDGSPATKANPTWTGGTLLAGTGGTDCGKCHGNPPNSAGHSGVTANQCNSCHSHAINGATAAPFFSDISKHLNGVLDGGISNGGQLCYGCHGTYQTAMEDGTGTKTGATRTSFYHHVLGGTAGDGEIAPNAGSYQTSTTDVYCTSCHGDHNYFNANKGANLRSNATVATVTASNTDFSATSPNGVCVSCHTNSLTKDTANQKSGGAATTPAISGANYNLSMHNYTSTSLYGTSRFDANCSKCHSDEQTKDKQTSAKKFGTHFTALRSITNPLGITTPTDPLGANFCYRCHSKTTDTNPGGGPAKGTAGRDYLGSQAMIASAEDTFAAMQLGSASLPGGQPTTSTNTLHFLPGTEYTPPGTLPTAHLSTADTFAGGTFRARGMAPYPSTTAYESWDTTAVSVTASTQNWRRVSFISPTVATAFSTGTGTWAINIYDRESSTNANARVRYAIYTINSAGALKSTIVARANGGTEMAITAAPGALQAITTAAGTNTSVAVGDRVVVDLEIQTLSVTTAGSYSMTFFYGNGAASNVVMPVSATFNYTSQATPASGRHDVASYKGLHKYNETRTDIAAAKHVECSDCHEPHQAKQGLHTKGSGTLAGVLTGATGVTVTTWGANWAGVTTWTQGTTAALPAATAEWQICFKCHSAANANYATWGGAGANAWTDLALEFNPNNESYHPVIQALPSTGNRRLASTALTGGWTPGLVMNCSDCHGSDSAGGSRGPHGASVKWMLNPNTTATKYYNWPYTTAAGNGGSTGTLITGTGTTTVPGTNFCFSCHVWSGGGTAHTGRSDHAVACVGCHIRVPHGGKALRLLTGTNAPARYKPNGNGGGTFYMNGGSRPASGTMGESNCQTASGCTQHTATGTLLGW